MPSAFGHIAAAAALSTAFPPAAVPRRLWPLGLLCAVLPDVDSVGFHYGIPYDHVFGHRGFCHSILFALVVAYALTEALRILGRRPISWMPVFFYLALCGISHGLLDALTDGGLGVAFFAPFWNERLFFPCRPIHVSPLSIRAFLTGRGIYVLRSEAIWIGIPSLVFAAVALAVQRKSRCQVPRP